MALPVKRRSGLFGRMGGLKAAFMDWLAGAPEPVVAPKVEMPEEIDEAAAYRQLGFTFAVIALSAKLVRAEGLTRDAFVAFREVFPLEDEDSAKLRSLFRLAWDDGSDAEAVARQVAYLYPDQPGLWRELLGLLAAVAQADGPLTTEELRLLISIGAQFGFSRAQVGRVIASASDERKVDPLRVLGLKRGARHDEVKERYRALMRRYHPDAIVGRVSYPEALAAAQKRSAKINEAYHALAG